jgi:Tol biopolymer transport system component
MLNRYHFIFAATIYFGCFGVPFGISGPTLVAQEPVVQSQEQTETAETKIEPKFLSNTRQITFEGKRSGEGYYSTDGTKIVFQSERREDNPFYQIYLLDFEFGDIEPISPGHGKTTCAWIHPNGNDVLFSSTQDDPEARNKQRAEIEFRESGQTRRYSWDYDPTYEVYSFDRTTKKYTRLTNAEGYDAEGSYSPDGQWIAFASNRNGFSQPLDDEQKKLFETDPAYMMDIFIMKADGSEVKQLTDVPGYDGGPFFSPDGKRICWRRFSENGLTAEIMTMNVDGSDQQQITKMGAMSWAPFYHPTGKYLVYTTNKHGFGNFELYLVAADGKSPPVRVTDTDGFDGLASFTPDGTQLTWTSTRNAKKESQIYLADWNHKFALSAFEAASAKDSANLITPVEIEQAQQSGLQSARASDTKSFRGEDIMRHVNFLCRPELGGRMTGSRGEKMATTYVAAYFDYLGLKPAGDTKDWYQEFEFPNGAKLGAGNQLTSIANSESTELKTDSHWRPLVFSGSGSVKDADVVFAGYGIVAPEKEGFEEYDSYVHLDVKDKWVVMFRFVPESVSPELRQHLQFYAGLRKKAFFARERGAAGVIVVSGPNSQVKNQLVPLYNDFSPSGSKMPSISVTDQIVSDWLKLADRDLTKLQTKLDDGSPVMGFPIKGLKVSATTEVEKVTGRGRNVLGRLMAGDTPSEKVVIVGAHIDHLGTGKTGGSLAKSDESEQIHFGADDNASGIAAMLEIAEFIATRKKAGKLTLKHDVIFAGWSGEELGLHGSQHFIDSYPSDKNDGTGDGAPEDGAGEADDKDDPKAKAPANSHDFIVGIGLDGSLKLNGSPTTLEDVMKDVKFIGKSMPDFPVVVKANSKTKPDVVAKVVKTFTDAGLKNLSVMSIKTKADDEEPAEGESTESPAHPFIVAALNMDMVGRFEEKVVLQGIGSSDYWTKVIESKNAVVGLPLTLSDDTDLPTDASSFYRAGAPILSAFTGSHSDYHTPRDTPDKLNYPDAARIAKLMGLITRQLAMDEQGPVYVKRESKPKDQVRGGMRAYLGTVPDYGQDVEGVKLGDVTKGAPAADAGVLGGDIIVELSGKKIENIYDYTAILDGVKIGQETSIVVLRDDKRIELKITPSSRQ